MFACSLLRNRQQNWVSVNFTVTVFRSESNFTFEKKNAKVVSPSVTSSPIITFQHHFFSFLTFPHYHLLCSHVAHKKPFRHVLTPSPSTSCAHLPILSALLSAWSALVRIKSEGHFWSWKGTKDAISVHTKLKIQNFSSFSFNRGSIDSSSLQIVVKARNVFMFLNGWVFKNISDSQIPTNNKTCDNTEIKACFSPFIQVFLPFAVSTCQLQASKTPVLSSPSQSSKATLISNQEREGWKRERGVLGRKAKGEEESGEEIKQSKNKTPSLICMLSLLNATKPKACVHLNQQVTPTWVQLNIKKKRTLECCSHFYKMHAFYNWLLSDYWDKRLPSTFMQSMTTLWQLHDNNK